MKNNKQTFLILLLIIPALACSSTLNRPALISPGVTTVTVNPSPSPRGINPMKLKVLQHDRFKNREGENVNRLAVDVNGHKVQVLQYDESPNVLVFVDHKAALLPIQQVGKFVADRTGEG
jgi:hypothetical protein